MATPVATPVATPTAARTLLALLLAAVVAASMQAADKQDAKVSSGSSEATALLSPTGADPYKSGKLQLPAQALPPQAPQASRNDERQRFLNVVLPTAAKTTARAPAKALEQLRVNKQQQERDREELDYRYYWGNTGARVEGYDPGYGGGGGGGGYNGGGNYPQVDLGENTSTQCEYILAELTSFRHGFDE